MKQKKKDDSSCVIGGLLLVCAGLLWYMVSHSLDFSVGSLFGGGEWIVYVHRRQLAHCHE